MRLVMGSESTSTPSQSKSTASKKSLAIGRENEWFLEQARIPHEAVNCAFRVCSFGRTLATGPLLSFKPSELNGSLQGATVGYRRLSPLNAAVS